MNYDLNGLYVITDQKLINRDKFVQSVERALAGGANIIQLREKGTEPEVIIYLGKEILKITKRYSVPLIINDSPEIACEIGADGVHLGQEDISVQEARKIIGKDKIIGVSCYGELQRGIDAENMGADYVAFGTPYNTPTKPGRRPTPFSTLIEAKSKIKNIPIFAIGGITKDNARDVLQTGVDGIAVITSIFGSGSPEDACREFTEVLKSDN